MAPAKGPRSKVVLDPPAAPGDPFAPPVVDADKPAKDQVSEGGNGNNDNEIPSSHMDNTEAGGSGLTMAERQSVQAHGSVEEILLEDDSDDEMEVDHDKEAAMNFRTTVILLLPFVLAQEVACVMDTVKMLMKRGWNAELSLHAWSTTKFQELQALYIAKVRYCRLQLSFLLERDAEICTSKEVVYQRLNGKLVKLHWQHTDNAAFVRERSLRPAALEVIFRDVSATVEIGMLTDRLSTYKLQKSQRPAFLRCSAFHRVLHPVTGADTDVVKGLAYPHPAASLKATSILLPILRDPALALISTGSNREEWLCTQAGCKKAHGKCFMTASDHIASAAHLICQEKLGTATKSSLERTNLAIIKKDFGI
ncbi:unnamed protein product [Closterium sp. Naga37s-1]|nr:unnamed protein product [Closterium sp. Naga37s-1]